MPHLELGEVVGIATVCESGISYSLTQLRRCGAKSGLIGRQWLPELLVHVNAIPKGATGKPARIGLAEQLGIPTLSFSGQKMLTIDVRGRQPLEYEASLRADARKASSEAAAAKRKRRTSAMRTADGTGATAGATAAGATAGATMTRGGTYTCPCCNHEKLASDFTKNQWRRRKDGTARCKSCVQQGVNINAARSSEPLSTDTVVGCIQLVTHAMQDVTGQSVLETDDLFDMGLSSITTTRMRDVLEQQSGLSLPPNILHDNTTARALAAALFCLKHASTDDSSSIELQDGSASVALIMAEAMGYFRAGKLDHAERLCMCATKNAGLTEGWHQQSHRGPISESAPPELDAALSLLVSIWSRYQWWQEAMTASKHLLALRNQPSASSDPVSVALIWAQLAQLAAKAGDGLTEEHASVEAASAAATACVADSVSTMHVHRSIAAAFLFARVETDL